MTTFEDLAARWKLKLIRSCPGRFIIDLPTELTPQELLGTGIKIHAFNVSAARDTVLVARIEGGGLISYRHANGKYLHTLNTDEGFARKLGDLGIEA